MEYQTKTLPNLYSMIRNAIRLWGQRAAYITVGIFPWTFSSSLERMLWILLSENWSSLTVMPPFHQESWWFMLTTANQGTICLRQFLSTSISFSFSHTQAHILRRVWSLISCSVSRVEAFTVDPSSHSPLCSSTTVQTFSMMDGAG